MSGIIGETGSRSGVVSPSWISLSSYLQTHFTQTSSTNYPVRYKKVGELIYLEGMITKASTDNTTMLSGIPTEMRPKGSIIAYQQTSYNGGSTADSSVIWIHYNGTIGFQVPGGNYASTDIPINCVYSV